MLLTRLICKWIYQTQNKFLGGNYQMAKQQTTFTVNEIVAILQQLASESEDGKLDISQIVSALSRANNRQESVKFREITGRDSFGRVTKAL